MLRWYVDDRVAGLNTGIFYRRQKTSQERDLDSKYVHKLSYCQPLVNRVFLLIGFCIENALVFDVLRLTPEHV